jgi:hypothetical protein
MIFSRTDNKPLELCDEESDEWLNDTMDEDVQSHIHTSWARTSHLWGAQVNLLSTDITCMLSDSQTNAKSTARQVKLPIHNGDEDLGSESELEDAALDITDLPQQTYSISQDVFTVYFYIEFISLNRWSALGLSGLGKNIGKVAFM